MSYTIAVRVADTSVAGFAIVEQSVWHYANGGTWSQANNVLTLSMGGSGTSGGLRFQSSAGDERFTVLLGVHNYKRWCDIVTDLVPSDTNFKIQPTYYQDGVRSRSEMLWKWLSETEKKSSKGTAIRVQYTREEDHKFQVMILIS